MQWIAGANGTGSSTSITLSSIPQTFTHLQVRGIARSAGVASQFYMRVNNDGAGTSYASHYIYGDGSGVAAGSAGAPTSVHLLGNIPASTDTANAYTAFVIDLLDYTNTNKNKTFRALSGFDLNGSGLAWFTSAVWLNTAAINAVTIVANANLTNLSRIDLYGTTTSAVTGA